MKASILRRLEALEQATNPHTIPPLCIVDVTQLPDDDRVAYWSGGDDVLNRYAPPVPDMPPGTITTIIVSVNAESRAIWEAARTMTDEEYDRWDDDRTQDAKPDPSPQVPETAPEPRFDKWGYRIPGEVAGSAFWSSSIASSFRSFSFACM